MQSEISCTSQKPNVKLNNNATSCYNQIIPSVASLFSESHGIHQNMTILQIVEVGLHAAQVASLCWLWTQQLTGVATKTEEKVGARKRPRIGHLSVCPKPSAHFVRLKGLCTTRVLSETQYVRLTDALRGVTSSVRALVIRTCEFLIRAL